MDSVRFGRALGVGARLAARTLVTAVDAAAAPNPSSSPRPPLSPAPTQADARTPSAATHPAPPTSPPSAAHRAGQSAARIPTNLRDTTIGVARGSRRFREATWGPVVKLSGVLWLEFTGVFFGIFALFAAGGAWKLRDNLYRTSTSADGRIHFELAAAMAVVFGYFCLSSFLRARRRSRRS